MSQFERDGVTAAGAIEGLPPIALTPERSSPHDWLPYCFPPALLLLSLAIIAGTWLWLGAPAADAPHFGSGKLHCVSYAPFRDSQNPLTPGLMIGARQIAEDLDQLAGISDCVRTYSTGNGLDQVPAMARRAGLKLLLGIWIGTRPSENLQQIETAIALANDYADVVSAVIVGNEVLLRREMTASDLAGIVRSVKARVKVPVTYADVWDVWLRSHEVSAAVDFVTVHVLPYWDDLPISAVRAAAHVGSMRQRIAAAFPDKEIFVGEVGWPSAGRMREGALPSPANQVRVISNILALAAQQNFRVNLIEAYDQPWKAKWEGTVGRHWGLFDSEARALKYPAGVPVRNHPFWEIQMAGGIAFCLLIFAVAYGAGRQTRGQSRPATWFAIALVASVSGVLLGMAIERTLLQGFGIAGSIRCGVLLAVATGGPLLCAIALMTGVAPPTFSEVMGVRGDRRLPGLSLALGAALTLTTLAACETALGLVFDPRYRDFPFAPLTMAVLPYLILRSFDRRQMAGSPPLAEAVFCVLFGMSAACIAFNEGRENWQSLWTCAAYLALGSALWLARAPGERTGFHFA